MDENRSNPDDAQATQESFIRLLLVDVANASDRALRSDSQAMRRDLVRSSFAAIEGIVWSYRENIESTASEMALLTRDEEAALSESVFQVSSDGRVTKQARFVPLPAMFRLTTRIAQKIDSTLQVEFNSPGWQQLGKAGDIRNRITHPKTRADLTISDDDLAICKNALNWIIEVYLRVIAATNSAFAHYVDEMYEVVAALKANDPVVLAEYRRAAEDLQSGN